MRFWRDWSLLSRPELIGITSTAGVLICNSVQQTDKQICYSTPFFVPNVVCQRFCVLTFALI